MFQHKIVEIKNPLFIGFYGTSVLNIDEEGNGIAFNEWYSLNSETNDFIKDNDIYNESNYKEYEKNVTKRVNDYFIEKVNKLAYANFNIKNLLGIKTEELMTSPEYYNYETDKSFLKVKVDGIMTKFINIMFNKYSKELDEEIIDNHTSYDGFISYYSNNFQEWYDKRFELDYNELATVFACFLEVFGVYDDSGNVASMSDDTINDLYEIAEECYYNNDHWFEKRNDDKKYSYEEILKASGKSGIYREIKEIARIEPCLLFDPSFT